MKLMQVVRQVIPAYGVYVYISWHASVAKLACRPIQITLCPLVCSCCDTFLLRLKENRQRSSTHLRHVFSQTVEFHFQYYGVRTLSQGTTAVPGKGRGRNKEAEPHS